MIFLICLAAYVVIGIVSIPKFSRVFLHIISTRSLYARPNSAWYIREEDRAGSAAMRALLFSMIWPAVYLYWYGVSTVLKDQKLLEEAREHKLAIEEARRTIRAHEESVKTEFEKEFNSDEPATPLYDALKRRKNTGANAWDADNYDYEDDDYASRSRLPRKMDLT